MVRQRDFYWDIAGEIPKAWPKFWRLWFWSCQNWFDTHFNPPVSTSFHEFPWSNVSTSFPDQSTSTPHVHHMNRKQINFFCQKTPQHPPESSGSSNGSTVQPTVHPTVQPMVSMSQSTEAWPSPTFQSTGEGFGQELCPGGGVERPLKWWIQGLSIGS